MAHKRPSNRRAYDRKRKKKWYRANSEKKAALNRAYYEAHRDELLERARIRNR